jgi:hypothetical protein
MLLVACAKAESAKERQPENLSTRCVLCRHGLWPNHLRTLLCCGGSDRLSLSCSKTRSPPSRSVRPRAAGRAGRRRSSREPHLDRGVKEPPRYRRISMFCCEPAVTPAQIQGRAIAAKYPHMSARHSATRDCAVSRGRPRSAYCIPGELREEASTAHWRAEALYRRLV